MVFPSGGLWTYSVWFRKEQEGIPGGPVVKNLPANEGDMGSNPGLGRSHILGGN